MFFVEDDPVDCRRCEARALEGVECRAEERVCEARAERVDEECAGRLAERLDEDDLAEEAFGAVRLRGRLCSMISRPPARI